METIVTTPPLCSVKAATEAPPAFAVLFICYVLTSQRISQSAFRETDAWLAALNSYSTCLSPNNLYRYISSQETPKRKILINNHQILQDFTNKLMLKAKKLINNRQDSSRFVSARPSNRQWIRVPEAGNRIPLALSDPVDSGPVLGSRPALLINTLCWSRASEQLATMSKWKGQYTILGESIRIHGRMSSHG